MKNRNRTLVVILSALCVLVIAAVAFIANQRPLTTVTVTHAVVTPTSTIGAGIGTVRTFFIPIDVDGVSADNQYLSGTLTTLSDSVNGDEELRSANLVFVFGDEANQLVVGGISLYPPAGSTIAVGAETVRPVVGGSGVYAGATGEVVSTNLGDEGWSHVFHINVG
jgi:hypothetical protein